MTPEELDRTARALLDTAEARTRRVGARGLSLRPLTEAVGVSTQAVYTCFGGRPGLVAGLRERLHVGLDARLRDAVRPSSPIGERLVAVAEALRAWAQASPGHFTLLYGTPVSTDEDLGPPGVLRQLADEAVGGGEDHGLRVEAVIEALWVVLLGALVVDRSRPPGGPGSARRWRQVLRLLEAALRLDEAGST